jgi:peroxiredoxin
MTVPAATPAPAVEAGQLAPDFTLKGPAGQPVTLSEYRGKRNVVLVFYPLAFSPVCSAQLPEIDEQMGSFEDLDAVVFGISVDSHYSNEAFAKKLGISFPLLSDFDRRTSAAYGVLNERRGYSGRALFVIDKQGRVAFTDVSASPGDPSSVPRPSSALDVLRQLRG